MVRRRCFVTALCLTLLASVLGACGDDTATTVTTTPAGPILSTDAPAGTDEPVPTLALEDACSLVPRAQAAEATGLPLRDGVPDGDARRRACTFNASDNGGVGITVGVQPGSRFEEKADTSRRSLGVEGEAVADLGDKALFIYSNEDIPEGTGGVLVAVGDLTVEVTMQGLDEDAMRTASTALARVAVGNL